MLAFDTQERWLIDLQQLPAEDVVTSGLRKLDPAGTPPTSADRSARPPRPSGTPTPRSSTSSCSPTASPTPASWRASQTRPPSCSRRASPCRCSPPARAPPPSSARSPRPAAAASTPDATCSRCPRSLRGGGPRLPRLPSRGSVRPPGHLERRPGRRPHRSAAAARLRRHHRSAAGHHPPADGRGRRPAARLLAGRPRTGDVLDERPRPLGSALVELVRLRRLLGRRREGHLPDRRAGGPDPGPGHR